MKGKNIFLFLLLLVLAVPFGLAATEDAIREVGYSFVAVVASGAFTYLVFYLSSKLDDQHQILKLLLMFVGFSGILNMTGMIANQGGKFFSLFQVSLYTFYAIIAYIIVALFLQSSKWLRSSYKNGGRKDD